MTPNPETRLFMQTADNKCVMQLQNMTIHHILEKIKQ